MQQSLAVTREIVLITVVGLLVQSELDWYYTHIGIAAVREYCRTSDTTTQNIIVSLALIRPLLDFFNQNSAS